jgi:hypothetical protein
MAEEVEALVVGMVEASAVVAISVAIALRNTEEGISITEIVSGTIVISFLEVPSGMMTPTTGMTIIRTMDIATTAFTASCSNPVDKLSFTWPDRRSAIEAAASGFIVITSRYSRVNTRAGAWGLVASRLFQTAGRQKGRIQSGRWIMGAPNSWSQFRASPGGSW